MHAGVPVVHGGVSGVRVKFLTRTDEVLTRAAAFRRGAGVFWWDARTFWSAVRAFG